MKAGSGVQEGLASPAAVAKARQIAVSVQLYMDVHIPAPIRYIGMAEGTLTGFGLVTVAAAAKRANRLYSSPDSGPNGTTNLRRSSPR